MSWIAVCFFQYLAGISLKTMIHTIWACATWITERWICSWLYRLSTSSSTM